MRELPSFLMLSENYYRRTWRLGAVRRLKNIICFLEWVPNVERLRRFEAGLQLSGAQAARLADVLELHDPEGEGAISGAHLRLLLQELGISAKDEEALLRGGPPSWDLEALTSAASTQERVLDQNRHNFGQTFPNVAFSGRRDPAQHG